MNTSQSKFDKLTFLNKRQYRILFHLVFWVVYIGSITFFFGDMLGVQRIFVRTFISAFFNAILVYINLYLFLPRYFEQGRYTKYLIFLNALVLLIMVARAFSDSLLPVYFHPNKPLKAYLFTPIHFFSIVLSSYLVLLLSISIKFVKDYFMNIQMREQMLRMKYEAELKNLKNQLNPHFLFNTLNNIYSHAYLKSDKAGPMILKLSDMMRYVLYECDDEKVPLSKEVEYLANYFSLQKMRKNTGVDIDFKVEGDILGLMIEPLIFLPLFENVFKHGNIDEVGKGWMKAVVEYKEGQLLLDVSNSFVPQKTDKKKVGGIGLKNIRERLNILYPGKHGIIVSSNNNVFDVHLYIELK